REARHLGKIEFVGDFEAQERVVELEPLRHFVSVEAKMAQPPHLERAGQENTANVILLCCHSHMQFPPWSWGPLPPLKPLCQRIEPQPGYERTSRAKRRQGVCAWA